MRFILAFLVARVYTTWLSPVPKCGFKLTLFAGSGLGGRAGARSRSTGRRESTGFLHSSAV